MSSSKRYGPKVVISRISQVVFFFFTFVKIISFPMTKLILILILIPILCLSQGKVPAASDNKPILQTNALQSKEISPVPHLNDHLNVFFFCLVVLCSSVQ